MATIIDALAVELNLDPKQFEEGLKRVMAASAKGKTQAVSDARSIEEATGKAAKSFDRLTDAALGFAAVLLGARGLKDFLVDITGTDVRLGRLSNSLGLSAQSLASWEMMGQRVGGTVSGMDSTFETLGRTIYNLKLASGTLPQAFNQLRSLGGGGPLDFSSPESLAVGIAADLQRAHQRNPILAHGLAQDIGVDPGFEQLAYKYGGGIMTQISGANPYAPSDATIKSMQDLLNQWTTLQQQATAFAQTVVGQLAPILSTDMKDISGWLADPKNLKTVSDDAKDVANSIGSVAISLGGLGNAITALAAVWAASKFGLGGLIPWLAMLSQSGSAPNAATQAQQNAFYAANPQDRGIHASILGYITDWLGWTHPDVLTNSSGSPDDRDKSAGTMASYIRMRAMAMGIDPDVALSVAAHEGLNSYVGDDGSSFGPFQLHEGGISGRFPQSGMGDDFVKATGLDPRDPKTWRSQVDYALAQARANGWGAWAGARAAGITGFQGIGAASISVNGPITIVTQATDAVGIGKSLRSTLANLPAANAANGGPK